MKQFMRIMRRMIFIFLMLLAAIAVGITGAAPIMPRNRERHNDIEMVVKNTPPEDNESSDAWEEHSNFS